MLQVGGDLDLGQEPFEAEYGTEFGFQDFQRDIAVVLDIAREVDGGHAALAELAFDGVPAREGRGKAVGLPGHAGLGRERQ